MLEIGSTAGRYTVTSLLADGDLAVTYKVEADGVPYALRLLVIRDSGFSERLRRAAAAQQGLHHPNLVRVIEVIEVDPGGTKKNGAPGVVTEFVDGGNLERWIASGPHRPADVLVLFRQMVEGVRAAHEAGLLHRNLKPSKVLVGRDAHGMPQVRISDFLLGKVRAADKGAAVTQLGTTFGTPQYMSPEQFRGAATVDERGDLFSLGCLLYEMATGQRAFTGKNLLEVYQQVAGCDYAPVDEVRPELPPWVGEIVDELLTPDPEERVQTAAALAERLRGLDTSHPGPAAVPEPAPLAASPKAPPPAPAPPRAPAAAPSPGPQPLSPVASKPARAPAAPTIAPSLDAEDDSSEEGEDPLPPLRSGPPAATVLLLSLGLGLAVGLVFMMLAGSLVWWWMT